MLDKPTNPLDIARTVLRPETSAKCAGEGSQFSLFDSGQVGIEPARRPAPSGSDSHAGLAGGAGSAMHEGSERAELGFGLGGEQAGNERLGDFAERRVDTSLRVTR